MKQQSPHVEKLELGSVLSSGFSLKSWVGEICKEEQQLYTLLLQLGDECILLHTPTHKFEVWTLHPETNKNQGERKFWQSIFHLFSAPVSVTPHAHKHLYFIIHVYSQFQTNIVYFVIHTASPKYVFYHPYSFLQNAFHPVLFVHPSISADLLGLLDDQLFFMDMMYLPFFSMDVVEWVAANLLCVWVITHFGWMSSISGGSSPC